MSTLTRAFTKRNKRPEVSGPMPYREGQPKFSSGTIRRGKISGPVELLSTTNMLAYNAPDLNSATSSSSSSLRSPDDSEMSFSPHGFGSPLTTPDESPREISPIEPNPQASYFPKRSATVTSHPRSSTSTASSTDAPMLPRRALSHTKRSHQELARQRSLSRLEPPPLSAARSNPTARTPPDAVAADAHPFGKELEQVNEVAEEFGGTTRGLDEEEAILYNKGLKKFTVDDYLVEVNAQPSPPVHTIHDEPSGITFENLITLLLKESTIPAMVTLAPTTTLPRTPTATKPNPSSMPAASSPLPVPILKTSKNGNSTPSVKRKMVDMDLSLSPSSAASEGSDGVPSPKKRRVRVQFDKDVEMREVPANDSDGSPTSNQLNHNGSGTEKSAAVVREEVRRALQRHISGSDSEAYDRIKEIFAADPRQREDDGSLSYDIPTHTTLKHHLMGLLSNVASLDRSCNGLVHAVLNSEWAGRDESYVKLFVRFLGNLAAAQGSYLGAVLKMLVNYLGAVPRGTGKIPGYVPVQASEVHTRVHMALRHVLQLIPSGSGSLSPILSINFPFDTDSPKSNIAYTRNILRVINYAPELQADVLALVTEKLVKIDVQIQVDMEDFEDEVGEDLLHDTTAGEEEDDDDASIASDESVDDESERVQAIKNNILKLDGMIDLLFEYYSPPFTSGTLDDKENTLDLLISHFQNIILPTYRSRHSQFLLFHFSQSSPALVDRFAATCVQLLFNKLQPGIMRQSAAAYLASFVARGAHISGEVIRDVFDLLTTHLDNLRIDYEPACRGPDLRRYSPFYSTAQALLYIFCFRWRDLTTAAMEGDTADQVDELEPEDIEFPPYIKETLHKAIQSKLNPLKVCSPAIVTEFARISNHLDFLYLFSILETNKRLRITSFRNMAAMSDPRYSQVERETRAGDDLGYQLDAYFPFDPYQLPRSRRWLEGDYVHWRGIAGLHDDDDDDESDGSADEDEDVDDLTGTDEED